MATKKQPTTNTQLQQQLQSMGVNVRPQSQWGQTLNAVQRQADQQGQSYTAYLPVPVTPKKGPPAQPNYVPTQGYGATNRQQPGYLTANQQGPRTRQQQSGMQQPQAAAPIATQPAPRRSGGYAFTQAQPVLAQAAADQLRQQYAGVVAEPGQFYTDTNEGLLQLLQGAGIQPTPLAQWGQLLNRLQGR